MSRDTGVADAANRFAAPAPPQACASAHVLDFIDDTGRLKASRGIVVAVLIAVPFWSLLGFVAYLLF